MTEQQFKDLLECIDNTAGVAATHAYHIREKLDRIEHVLQQILEAVEAQT